MNAQQTSWTARIALLVAASVVAANCSSDPAPNTALSSSTEPEAVPAPEVDPEPDINTTAAATETSEDETNEPAGDANFMTGDSSYLFDQERLHTFEINLPEESLAEIDADPAAEEYVEGSFTFDGETIDPIGIRYKGSIGAFLACTSGPNPFDPSGSKTCTKLSMKLKINWNDPDALFYGVRKVQLHSQNLDPTNMHERLGYWLFREMGVPAPRSTHARVIVNGEFLGLFALTEQIDGRFTRENFDDGTGNLYKEVWPFDQNGDVTADDRFIAGLKTNEDEDPNADIIRKFSEAVRDAAPGDAAVQAVAEYADVEQWLRYWVVDRTIAHDDGPFHWYCIDQCEPHNFYLYENPTDETIDIVPWDLDNAFGALDPDNPDQTNVVIAVADEWGGITDDCAVFPFGPLAIPQKSAACDPLMSALATLDEEYATLLAEFIAGPLSEERVNEQLGTWEAQIAEAVGDAAAAHDDATSVEEWQEALDKLRRDLDTVRS